MADYRDMNIFAVVEVDNIDVRQTADSNSTIIIRLKKGDTFQLLNRQGSWLECKYGWLKEEKKNDKMNVNIITQSQDENKALYNDLLEQNKKQDEDDGTKSNYSYIEDYKFGSSSNQNENFIKNVRGIYGMPYQFNSLADRRYDNSVFGRKYAEKIVSRMPLLLLTPGVPKFMAGYTKKDKKNILSYLGNRGENDGILNALTGDMDDGKFYSFEFAYKSYYKAVNLVLQRMAVLLGIGDKKIDGTALSSYRWENYANDSLTGFVSSKESIAFYVDAETQISESFTNETQESMLSGSVNGLSDMAKELQFLLGGVAGMEFESLKAENRNEVLGDFNKFSEKYLGIFPQDLLNKLSGGVLTVASGGKLIFPEIWTDSSFSRSYNIKMKLRTPDADVFSWYMNIAVPMIHLMHLAAPRQMSSNSYQAPYMVRGYYKGIFNCDMGIITQMEFEKGDKGRWTTNGLPMVVDVSFTIKDLYQMMCVTSGDTMFEFLNNTVLLDYIANMCGININKPDILRTVDLYYNYFVSAPSNLLNNTFLGVEEQLSKMANAMYNKFR
ncbi:MAG: hypothetical protein ACRCXT_18180 [Paraclostridium sp.]